jgi:tetratricopeptide (TPR) repeat protein
MRIVFWASLAAGVALQDGAAAAGGGGVFDRRMAGALRKAAETHVKLGQFCESKKQLAWAKHQFEWALQCDPENAEAKRRLARGIGWKNATPQELEEPGPPFKEAAAKAYEIFKPAGEAFLAVARWADKSAAKARAEEAWRRAIEYYPECEEARKRLGHERVDFEYSIGRRGESGPYAKAGLRWSHTAEAAFRKEFRERMAQAPKPEPYVCNHSHGNVEGIRKEVKGRADTLRTCWPARGPPRRTSPFSYQPARRSCCGSRSSSRPKIGPWTESHRRFQGRITLGSV